MQLPKSTLMLLVPAAANAWSFTGWDQTCGKGRSFPRANTGQLGQCQDIAAIRAIGPADLQLGQTITFYSNMQQCNTHSRHTRPEHYQVVDVDTLALDAIDEDCLTLQFTGRAFKVLQAN